MFTSSTQKERKMCCEPVSMETVQGDIATNVGLVNRALRKSKCSKFGRSVTLFALGSNIPCATKE